MTGSVLVTGATGFVGRGVVRRLVEGGWDVHAVTRDPGASLDGATLHEADLLAEPTAVVEHVRPAALVHLAWCTEHGSFWSSPANLRWVSSSLRLIAAFAEAGGSRAVVAGTCAEYDWTTGATVLGEDAPLAPATLYGAAKAGLHTIAAAYTAQHGTSLAWGRVFFPYGPGEGASRLIPSVAQALLDGRTADTTAGAQLRDFVHVDDVAGAFAALAGSDAPGAFNIGSGAGTSVRAVAELLGTLAGRPDLVRVGALPDRPGDPPAVVADIARLRAQAGWAPRVSLEDGLAGELEFLAAQGR